MKSFVVLPCMILLSATCELVLADNISMSGKDGSRIAIDMSIGPSGTLEAHDGNSTSPPVEARKKNRSEFKICSLSPKDTGIERIDACVVALALPVYSSMQ